MDLYKYINKIIQSNYPYDSLEHTLVSFCKEYRVDMGIVFSVMDDYESLKIDAAYGYEEKDINNFIRLDKAKYKENRSSIAIKVWVEQQIIYGKSSDPEYVSFNEEVKATLSIPLISMNKIIGILTFESKSENMLLELYENQDLVNQIAQLITINILIKGNKFVEFQNYISESIKVSPVISLKDCARFIQRLLNYQLCAIYIKDKYNHHRVKAVIINNEDKTDTFKNVLYKSGEDLIGWVDKHKKPLCLFNTSNTKEYDWYENKYGERPVWTGKSKIGTMWRFIAVPIYDGSRILGVLRLSDLKLSNLSEGIGFVDEKILGLIGESIATILNNSQRRKLLAREFAELWSIKENINFDQVIKNTLKVVIDNTNSTNAVLILTEDLKMIRNNKVNYNYYAYTMKEEDIENTKIEKATDDNTILGKLIKTNKEIIESDIEEITIYDQYTIRNIRAIIAIPILKISENRAIVLGAVIATSEIRKAFYEDDLWILYAVAEKLLDTFLVVQYEVNNNLLEAEVVKWKDAVSSGAVAAGEFHTARKALRPAMKGIKKLENFQKLKDDKKIFEEFEKVKKSINGS